MIKANVDSFRKEPFDEGFDRHIWSLSEQSLKWDREIAERRRTSPATVEQMMRKLIDRHRELEHESLMDTQDDNDVQLNEDQGAAFTYSDADLPSVTIYRSYEIR